MLAWSSKNFVATCDEIYKRDTRVATKMATLEVVILSVEDGLPHPNVQLLTNLFTQMTPHVRNIRMNAADGRYGTYRDILLSSSMDNTIMVRDTTVTALDAECIRRNITSVLDIAGMDACYLCSWQDDCTKYRDPIHGTMETTRSGGSQCILYTRSGKSKIGTSDVSPDITVEEGLRKLSGLSTRVFAPNIFSYDIARSRDVRDTAKMCLCGVRDPGPPPLSYSVSMVIVVVAIMILAWVVLPFPNDKKRI